MPICPFCVVCASYSRATLDLAPLLLRIHWLLLALSLSLFLFLLVRGSSSNSSSTTVIIVITAAIAQSTRAMVARLSTRQRPKQAGR